MRPGNARGPSQDAQHAHDGIYGLISMTGVPLTRSTPERQSVSPSMARNWTSDMPRGFGRKGDRVAKSPQRPPRSLGARTLAFAAFRPLRCAAHMSHTWLYSSRPSSAACDRAHAGGMSTVSACLHAYDGWHACQPLRPDLRHRLASLACGNCFLRWPVEMARMACAAAHPFIEAIAKLYAELRQSIGSDGSLTWCAKF